MRSTAVPGYSFTTNNAEAQDEDDKAAADTDVNTATNAAGLNKEGEAVAQERLSMEVTSLNIPLSRGTESEGTVGKWGLPCVRAASRPEISIGT